MTMGWTHAARRSTTIAENTESMIRSSASTTSAPSGDAAASGERQRTDRPSPSDTPTYAALLLCLAATVAAFGVLSPLVQWAIKPVLLPAPLPSQNQDAEHVVFL